MPHAIKYTYGSKRRSPATAAVQDENRPYDLLSALVCTKQLRGPLAATNPNEECTTATDIPRSPDPTETTVSSQTERLAKRKTISSDLCNFFAAPAEGLRTPKRKRRVPQAVKRSSDTDQLRLDLSDRPKTLACMQCGMVYTKGAGEDMIRHDLHHRRAVGDIEYVGWKADKTVECNIPITNDGSESGYIVKVAAAVKGLQRSKVAEILEAVDTELSSSAVDAHQLQRSILYLLVSSRHRVLACALVAPIVSAFPVVPAGLSGEGMLRFSDESSAIFCSPNPRSAQIGIHRIWTSRSVRRRGLACRLLDAVAAHSVYAQSLSCQQVAFSQPTSAGAALARRWTGREHGWLVFES